MHRRVRAPLADPFSAPGVSPASLRAGRSSSSCSPGYMQLGVGFLRVSCQSSFGYFGKKPMPCSHNSFASNGSSLSCSYSSILLLRTTTPSSCVRAHCLASLGLLSCCVRATSAPNHFSPLCLLQYLRFFYMCNFENVSTRRH